MCFASVVKQALYQFLQSFVSSHTGASQPCLIKLLCDNAVSSPSMLTSSASPSAAELVLTPSPEEAFVEVAVAAVASLLLLA